jgi:hypothetical protein
MSYSEERIKVVVGQIWISSGGTEYKITKVDIANNSCYYKSGCFCYIDRNGMTELGDWTVKNPGACQHDCCKDK